MKAPQKPTKEGRIAEKALKFAVANAIEEHRRLGLPIAVMRNGKAVYVRAAEKTRLIREPKATYRTKGKRGQTRK